MMYVVQRSQSRSVRAFTWSAAASSSRRNSSCVIAIRFMLCMSSQARTICEQTEIRSRHQRHSEVPQFADRVQSAAAETPPPLKRAIIGGSGQHERCACLKTERFGEHGCVGIALRATLPRDHLVKRKAERRWSEMASPGYCRERRTGTTWGKGGSGSRAARGTLSSRNPRISRIRRANSRGLFRQTASHLSGWRQQLSRQSKRARSMRRPPQVS